MSQIAAMVRGETDAEGPKAETARSHDPIQAILAGAGVEYTHLNNEVIGSSRVEERLSRRAEQVINDPNADIQIFEPSQSVGIGDDPFAEPLHQHPSPSGFRGPGGKIIRFKYNPPEDVKRRQFCSMARWLGYADATEFAIVVENMTQAQRRECLDKWYQERRNIVLSQHDKVEVKGEQ
jgi:hypothetical protein